MVLYSEICTGLDSIEQSRHLKYCAGLLYCCHKLFHDALSLVIIAGVSRHQDSAMRHRYSLAFLNDSLDAARRCHSNNVVHVQRYDLAVPVLNFA